MFEACKTSNIVISLDKKLGGVVITRHMKTKKYSFVSSEFQNSDAFIIHQITSAMLSFLHKKKVRILISR